MDLHKYRKFLFPRLREKRFVHRHRSLGHKLRHFGSAQPRARCYWRCDCRRRYWC